MTLVSLAAVVLLVPMLAISLWNLATAPRLERFGAPRIPRSVSLLIPARDEAENLRVGLPALLQDASPDVEIVVLDDASSDGTGAVVTEQAALHPHRVRLLHGRSLPAGWLGKNWACHQLAEAARGEVLIFCDADVVVRHGAVAATVGALETTGAGLMTALPKQRFGSWLEAAVVPLVAHLPVMALLPLSLVARVRRPTVSVANGQWLAFTREAYDACGGHAAVRADVVEDVALGRSVKAAGYRLLPMVATEQLEVRMYRSGSALREGFAKNLYPLLGGRPLPFLSAGVVFLLVAVYPWLGMMIGAPDAVLALALLVAVRISGALLLRQGVWSVVLHPAGSLTLLWIAVVSFRGWRRGSLRWKGREVGGRTSSGGEQAGMPRATAHE